MNIQLEWEDIKQHIPQLRLELEKEVNKNVFLSYSKGMIGYLFSNDHDFEEVIKSGSNKYYQKVNKIWNKLGNRVAEKDGIRGIYGMQVCCRAVFETTRYMLIAA